MTDRGSAFWVSDCRKRESNRFRCAVDQAGRRVGRKMGAVRWEGGWAGRWFLMAGEAAMREEESREEG